MYLPPRNLSPPPPLNALPPLFHPRIPILLRRRRNAHPPPIDIISLLRTNTLFITRSSRHGHRRDTHTHVHTHGHAVALHLLAVSLVRVVLHLHLHLRLLGVAWHHHVHGHVHALLLEPSGRRREVAVRAGEHGSCGACRHAHGIVACETGSWHHALLRLLLLLGHEAGSCARGVRAALIGRLCVGVA